MKDEEIDYSYGPKLMMKLVYFGCFLIFVVLGAEHLIQKKRGEVNKMEIEASEYKQESDLACAQANRETLDFIGKMYWADPMKFSLTEEEMIERAKAERPSLYSELIEKRAAKEKICGDAAIMQAIMESNVEARKKMFL
ncbi:hypothetical protein [Roseateles sp. PN1]|uniref:hypothetical protein n=1 Tax=Roseateles sp. PN1 TaxID=3137372 RepID=UPI00313A46D1